MSAKGRGAQRHPDDFYATPAWATRAILPHLPLDGRILEPAAGDGAIVRVLLGAGVDPWRISAVEIDAARAVVCARSLGDCLVADFLGGWSDRFAGLVIGNPPFKLALQFVQRSLGLAPTVAMLLRLSWLGSQSRAVWHREHPSDVYVLPKRPCFTGDGKTDATEYAWFVWGPPERDDRPGYVLEVSP